MKIILPQPKRAYCDPEPEIKITREEDDGDDLIRLDVGSFTFKTDASALMRALIALGVHP